MSLLPRRTSVEKKALQCGFFFFQKVCSPGETGAFFFLPVSRTAVFEGREKESAARRLLLGLRFRVQVISKRSAAAGSIPLFVRLSLRLVSYLLLGDLWSIHPRRADTFFLLLRPHTRVIRDKKSFSHCRDTAAHYPSPNGYMRRHIFFCHLPHRFLNDSQGGGGAWSDKKP